MKKKSFKLLIIFQNECLPRKAEEVKRVFEIEFGQSPEELFSEFDYTPIAAASLAQVFRAKTKDDRDVAVKVQYIDLINRFSGDFATILCIQELIKLIHKNYNFGWILRDLRKNLEKVIKLLILNETKAILIIFRFDSFLINA